MPPRLVTQLLACALVAACGNKSEQAPGGPEHGAGTSPDAETEARDPEAADAESASAEEPEPGEDAAEPEPDFAGVEPERPQLPEGIDSLPRPGRTPLAPPDLGPPTAGQTVAIPAGMVLLGSWPGAPGRDAAKQLDLVSTKFNAFEIDRLPYPNDPAQAPLTNVTRQEAERRCAEAGKRLCTEVEWEAACKGPQSQTYPYGDDYDEARYADVAAVVSSFGVLGLTTLHEWTGGEWKDYRGGAVANIAPVRGAPPGEGDERSRPCSFRTGLDPAKTSPRTGFRCCSGQGYPLPYEVEPVRRAIRPAPLLNDAMLARLVRSVPELRRVWANPRIQSENVLTSALLRSSRTEASGVGFSISIQPLFWIPSQGEELLAFVGRAGHDLFTAALYTTGIPDVYVHAASLVLTDVPDDEGIALYGGLRDRKLLGWGECDNCREGGSFEYHEEDGTITVGHRW